MDQASCKFCDEKLENLEKDKYSVLLGNGICISNSDLREKFQILSFDNVQEKVFKVFNRIYKPYLRVIDCPEKFLNIIRVETSYSILSKYKEIFDNFKKQNYNIRGFGSYLSGFKNIYTINYDPITYHAMIEANFIFEFLKEARKKVSSCDSESATFADGIFSNKNSIEKIKKTICRKGKGLYFLHGAFHIFQDQNNKEPYNTYYKLSTSSKNDDEIIKKNLNIIRTFRRKILNLSTQKYVEVSDITCLIETRPQNKLAWIKNDPYLSFCLERLCEQENILTLGCSFSNDDHILESLILSENVKDLSIGVFSSSDINNVHLAIGRLKRKHSIDIKKLREDYEKKLSFVCTQKLGKIIWNFNNSDTCKKINLERKNFDEL